MTMLEKWTAYAKSQEGAERLASLYGRDENTLAAQRARYAKLIERHEARFGRADGDICFFSAPGRTEIGGNHTDHNLGRVLAAAVNLDTVAAVTKSADGVIVVDSEGYRPITVDTADLSVREDELGTTAALIRGVAARMTELGYKVGGFHAAVTSNVLRGSGLSSSAAFEVLMAAILDGLYNGWVLDAKERAQIAQRAENLHFGKPCGLMDQMASSVGGLVTIDFKDPTPVVEALPYDFKAKGYSLVVVNTGGDHGDLTDDYAAIPAEMKAVAAQFGRKVLREIDPAEMEAAIPKLRGKVSDRAILRALHFYDDNARVPMQVAALRKDDLGAFLSLVIESGESSWKLLQNVYARPLEEQMALALELSRRVLKGSGAWRVHGGGFAGTIQAFVPDSLLDAYVKKLEASFGAGACTVLSIRPEGAVMMEVR
ncbi:galactokinase [Beduinella massiliensis]|uniref:galactokinase n=1 Tax=Beduinella massiliensis TaxID=1852363 RepID=UPI0031F9A894